MGVALPVPHENPACDQDTPPPLGREQEAQPLPLIGIVRTVGVVGQGSGGWHSQHVIQAAEEHMHFVKGLYSYQSEGSRKERLV